MALLLFDIDGTIIRPAGLGRRAFERALLEIYGSVPAGRFPFDGMLDTQIARETLSLMGIEPSREEIPALLNLYVRYLALERPADGATLACPGFPDLLDDAAARGHHRALLTGNVREGARLKLEFAGLDGYFSAGDGHLVGAFGGDAGERADLVPLAMGRCEKAFGKAFLSAETWIVGDSPRDVRAAREAGIRCAAVATGLASIGSLEETRPDLLLQDLSDAGAFWAGIEGGPPA